MRLRAITDSNLDFLPNCVVSSKKDQTKLSSKQQKRTQDIMKTPRSSSMFLRRRSSGVLLKLLLVERRSYVILRWYLYWTIQFISLTGVVTSLVSRSPRPWMTRQGTVGKARSWTLSRQTRPTRRQFTEAPSCIWTASFSACYLSSCLCNYFNCILLQLRTLPCRRTTRRGPYMRQSY